MARPVSLNGPAREGDRSAIAAGTGTPRVEPVPECYVCDLYLRKAKFGDWLTDVPVPDKTAGTGTPYG